jgi:soluble lytic murein transglycosylase-like protein
MAALMFTESAFYPRAENRSGAKGLTQLMPDTARSLGVTDVFDIEQNIRGGVTYFKSQLNYYSSGKYKGEPLDLSLAAYNAGPGSVAKYGGVPPFSETVNYIKSIRTYISEMK